MPCSLRFENRHRRSGFSVIVGVDEAGRGPLAGPVVVGAVILPKTFQHPKLNDSKKLDHKTREQIYGELTTDSRVKFASALATVEEIDRHNILRATHMAMERAVRALEVAPDIVLIDGLRVPNFPFHHEGIVKGDGISFSIAAASIIAKVERDRIMQNYALEYPNYAFDSHKGYGTKLHLTKLATHGPCPIHRTSFQPVAQRTFDFGEEWTAAQQG